MRNLNLYSNILFLTVLGSLLLPWVSIIRDWPFALSGLTIALSKFNIVQQSTTSNLWSEPRS